MPRQLNVEPSLVTRALSIAILEDDVAVASRLSRILLASPLIGSVHEYHSNNELLAALRKEKFNILLADIGLPDGHGTTSISAASKIQPNCHCIVISAMSDASTIMKAVEAGAIGYLHKDDDAAQIISSIELALSGGSPISPSIARQIIMRVKSEAPKSDPSFDSSGLLTPRQKEVLQILAKGLSYSETADVLNISANTLPVHVRNIYAKLHAHNRTEAISEARVLGIID